MYYSFAVELMENITVIRIWWGGGNKGTKDIVVHDIVNKHPRDQLE
jgi:hypothetical protein